MRLASLRFPALLKAATVVVALGGWCAVAQVPEDTIHAGATGQAPARRSPTTEQYAAVAVANRAGVQPVPVRNYIDEFVFKKISVDKIPHAGLSGDEEFLRRIHL